MTGQQLKEQRTQRGWDQARAAKELGVSIHTVRSWEQGKNPIPSLIEKHLLSEVDLKAPIDLIIQINQVASAEGTTFEEAFYKTLRKGLAAQHSNADQRPTSKKRGAKQD